MKGVPTTIEYIVVVLYLGIGTSIEHRAILGHVIVPPYIYPYSSCTLILICTIMQYICIVHTYTSTYLHVTTNLIALIEGMVSYGNLREV